MDTSILIGGFGGQGVQTMGKLLAHMANAMDMNVTFAPAYGGEMRGGTSNCTVVMSDKEVASPTRWLLDYIVAMNIESFLRFEQQVKPGGTFIINTSIVENQPTRSDITTVGVPVNDLAAKVGSDKVLNVVMLGFLVEYTKLIDLETAKAVVLKQLGKKKEYIKLNEEAFELGVQYAKEHFSA